MFLKHIKLTDGAERQSVRGKKGRKSNKKVIFMLETEILHKLMYLWPILYYDASSPAVSDVIILTPGQ